MKNITKKLSGFILDIKGMCAVWPKKGKKVP